jgi:hypothetical protein
VAKLFLKSEALPISTPTRSRAGIPGQDRSLYVIGPESTFFSLKYYYQQISNKAVQSLL